MIFIAETRAGSGRRQAGRHLGRLRMMQIFIASTRIATCIHFLCRNSTHATRRSGLCCADADGFSIWVGTSDAGLLHFEDGHFTRFTANDGFAGMT